MEAGSWTYELRLFDRPLAGFTAHVDALGRLSIGDVQSDRSASHLLPAMLVADASASGVLRWLSSRVIPKNRAFADKILEQSGLSPGDTLGIINVCKGLSVSDSYWVVPKGFEGSWDRYNLFDNDLDEILALVAYTGYTSSQRYEAGLSSEWTTDGTFPKCWRKIDGRLVLYKAGNPLNEGAANRDYSPYSEFLASQICDELGLEHVIYGLDMWRGRLAATCEAFTSPDISSVQLYHLTESGSLADNLAVLLALGDRSLLRRYIDIIWFDALIANRDRHAGNVAFLRDNGSGALLGFAPIYDNNMSLFPTDMPTDYPSWADRAALMYPSGSDISFDRFLAQVTQERHHRWARRLLTFSFENHCEHPMSPDRLAALDAFIQKRAAQLLDIPIVSDDRLLENIGRIISTSTVDLGNVPLMAFPKTLLPHSTEYGMHDRMLAACRSACDAQRDGAALGIAPSSRESVHL